MNTIRKHLKPRRDHFQNWLFERTMSRYHKSLRKRGLKFKVRHETIKNHDLSLVQDLVEKDFLKDWGVVFQGPLASDEQLKYFADSARFIRDAYPELTIVVSTYQSNASAQVAAVAEAMNIEVSWVSDVGSLPEPYPRSLCQQITSTSNGLRYARSLGIKKAVKIRTDQRITSPLAVSHMNRTLGMFPPDNDSMEHRIFSTSFNSYITRPLGMSDMLQFGAVSDLEIFWKPVTVEEWTMRLEQMRIRYTDKGWNRFKIPETWLCARYMMELGFDLQDPERSTLAFWRTIGGIVDAGSIGQEWKKSFEWLDTNYMTRKWFEEDNPPMNEELGFIQWLEIANSSRLDFRFLFRNI